MSDAIHSPTVAAEYLALEDLTGTFERLFQALKHLDPRHRGPPGQRPWQSGAEPTSCWAGWSPNSRKDADASTP
jgi:hypothetical protein